MNTSLLKTASATTIVRAFTLSFVSILTLGLISQVPTAEAKWTRTHASGCMAVQPGGTWQAPYDVSFGLWNDSANSTMVLLCPLSDTDYLAKGSLVTLNIHGKDGSATANVDAMVCRSNWGTTGGACSPVVSSPTGTPDYTLQPNITVLKGTAQTSSFAYVWVRLPAKSGTSRSGLRGIYTST